MQTNPAPMLHQQLNMAIKNRADNKPTKVKQKGLLGPRTMPKNNEQKDAEPIDRCALYMKLIQEKREELKNGNA